VSEAAQTREIDAEMEAEYPDQNHQSDNARRIEQFGIGHCQLRRDEGSAHRACHRKSEACGDLTICTISMTSSFLVAYSCMALSLHGRTATEPATAI
jgi:hypothetical protein